MKIQILLVLILCFSGILGVFCSDKNSKEINVQQAEKIGLVKSNENVMSRIKEVLQIPIYPGAKLAEFNSELPKKEILKEQWEAKVMLIVDDPVKVHKFYEDNLKVNQKQCFSKNKPDFKKS